MSDSQGPNGFKVCSACGRHWPSAEALLEDPELSFQGYQPFLQADHAGLLLFYHRPCGTTLALRLPEMSPVLPPPVLCNSRDLEGPDADFCLAHQNHEPCPGRCMCDDVAKVVATVERWPKALPGHCLRSGGEPRPWRPRRGMKAPTPVGPRSERPQLAPGAPGVQVGHQAVARPATTRRWRA